MNLPVRVAIIGAGGYALAHHAALRLLETQGLCRLVCTCDPSEEKLRAAALTHDFDERGVQTFADYRAMLETCADALDFVTIPAPVPLHAEMHRACIAAGLACYLEKPPTLYDVELEAMIAVDRTSRWQTQVGFNFIVEPARQSLKQRLLTGEFGALREVRFCGLWPRTDAYFRRVAWAGRLLMDGRPVLDSCFGNAMAHYLHNVFFWAGDDELLSWGRVSRVSAELYRAHAIEGADTLFAQAELASGVTARLVTTHACVGPSRNEETLFCDRAALFYVTGQPYRIVWHDGTTETNPLPPLDVLVANLTHYIHYLRGEVPRPLTRLEDSRPFVAFNTLAYVAANHITTLPLSALETTPATQEPGDFLALRNGASIAEHFLASGDFPTTQGLAWAEPGGTAHDTALLLPTLHRMLAERTAP